MAANLQAACQRSKCGLKEFMYINYKKWVNIQGEINNRTLKLTH